MAAFLSAVAGANAAEPDKPAGETKFSAEQLSQFEREVAPLLKEHCLKCHGGEKVKGGLRITSREHILKGGERGAAISLDKPEASLILEAVRYKDTDLQMPPSSKLPEEKIELLARWVSAGAPWKEGLIQGGNIPDEPAPKKSVDLEQGRKYWAYQPVVRPAVPAVKSSAWPASPIDRFILARLEAKGLAPNPPAARAALLRRVYYDLTGLPPTPEEVERFLADQSSGAYEAVVDRLLASPQYGEAWGRHWLDVVRYAESNGYERDDTKPFAWRYRDYVIRSFNSDKPYDQFIREQLAGDELPDPSADSAIATGFYRLGIWDDEPADRELAKYNELDDIVSTTGQAFLGMGLNCCRCHAHKADPIPQEDYYRLVAFFRDVAPYTNSPSPAGNSTFTDIAPAQQKARYEAEMKVREARKAELADGMLRLENAAIARLGAEDQRAAEGLDRPKVVAKLKTIFTAEEKAAYGKLKKERDELDKKPSPDQQFALSVNHCLSPPPETHVLFRGNPGSPAQKVEPGYPAVFGLPPPTIKPGARTSGRRSAIAGWIASPDNPLTARVMMNRLWQFHFGRGIVASPNDFGKLGIQPTHPELLDWLASEFVAGGWKIKRMQKLIVMSRTYQLSSAGQEQGLAADASNMLLWRHSMRRLSAEEMRDSILQASGQLNREGGGPSVFVEIPKEVLAGQSRPGNGWGKSSPAEASRRSVYVFVKRSLQVPILIEHDQADTDSSCPVRYTTTVPTQALGMLNGEFTNAQAAALAQRVQREKPGDLSAQVGRIISLTTSRGATAGEIQHAVEFIRSWREKHQFSEPDGLKYYCLLALCSNEFAYVD